MKVYQVVGSVGNGCSWNFEYTVAIYRNKEDAEMHALFANEWNRNAVDGRFWELKNPYDPEGNGPDANTSYGLEGFEVLESFEERV